jgi:hypothetical protein
MHLRAVRSYVRSVLEAGDSSGGSYLGRANQAAQKTAADAIARIHTPALSLTGDRQSFGIGFVQAAANRNRLPKGWHLNAGSTRTNTSGTNELVRHTKLASTFVAGKFDRHGECPVDKHYVRHDAEQLADALGWT